MSKWTTISCDDCSCEIHIHEDWDNPPTLCRFCKAKRAAQRAARWYQRSCDDCSNTMQIHLEWDNPPTLCRFCKAKRAAQRAAQWYERSCADCGTTMRIHQDWDNPPTLCRFCKTKRSAHLIISYDGKIFHLRPFDLINGYCIVDAGDSSLFVARTNLIDHSTLVLTEELEYFEWLINKSDVKEHEIQKFFEAHPKFLLGVEYKNLHAQLTLHREEPILGTDLRPDFFLESTTSNFCDIVDLKLPNEKLVVRKKNRVHFSAKLTEAMAQLREYRDYFDNPNYRNDFLKRYELQAFRPRVSVIMGRHANYYDEMERIKLESDLAHLRIVTYDDLLSRARRRLLMIGD